MPGACRGYGYVLISNGFCPGQLLFARVKSLGSAQKCQGTTVLQQSATAGALLPLHPGSFKPSTLNEGK